MKTTICLFFTLLLTLSGGESYFDESYQKTVNREVLEREIADSLLKASSALPAAEAFVQETVKADYLFADALEKRLELMKRLIRYIRTEQNRKQQPEGILYASHGARELIQFLEYFQLEKERFMQVHRSYIVNKAYIQEISKDHLVLFDGTMIPVGRKYRQQMESK